MNHSFRAEAFKVVLFVTWWSSNGTVRLGQEQKATARTPMLIQDPYTVILRAC